MYNLPVGLRNYYVELLAKTLEAEKEAIEKAQSKNKDERY
jgi:hypothetical protein